MRVPYILGIGAVVAFGFRGRSSAGPSRSKAEPSALAMATGKRDATDRALGHLLGVLPNWGTLLVIV